MYYAGFSFSPGIHGISVGKDLNMRLRSIWVCLRAQQDKSAWFGSQDNDLGDRKSGSRVCTLEAEASASCDNYAVAW